MSGRHIPAGREALWAKQADADAEADRTEKAADAAEKKRNDLAAALGWGDPLVDEADEAMADALDAHHRAVAIANRVYQERIAGLSSWIDHDPTAPICAGCNGGGCAACRGWGREYRTPVPVWSERDKAWIDPATGREVDLLAGSSSGQETVEKPDPEQARREQHNRWLDEQGEKAKAAQQAATDEQVRQLRVAAATAAKTQRHQASTGDGWVPPWLDRAPDTSRMSFADLADLAARTGDLLRAQQRQGDPQELVGATERAYQQYVRAQEEAGERIRQQRIERQGRPDLADLRRGTWHDEKPFTTSTNTGSGGAGVSSIDEVRAGIMAAIETANNEGLAPLSGAHGGLEQAQGMLMRAVEGSGQADASEATGMLAQAIGSVEETRQMVAAAISSAESVANRL